MPIPKKKTVYALGLLLCIIGTMMLLILVWKWWDRSIHILGHALNFKCGFWDPYDDMALGIGLKLVHYAILGVASLTVGSAILIAREKESP
jgi:hypothetical protein